jgi:hypothetical protein
MLPGQPRPSCCERPACTGPDPAEAGPTEVGPVYVGEFSAPLDSRESRKLACRAYSYERQDTCRRLTIRVLRLSPKVPTYPLSV